MRLLRWLWTHGVLNNFFAGLFLVLPIAVSIAVIGWIVDKLRFIFGPESVIGTGMQRFFEMVVGWIDNPSITEATKDWSQAIPLIIGWTLVIIAIWGLGVLIKIFAKDRLDETFQNLLVRIPLFNTIYKPVSQVFGLLKKDDNSDMSGMSVVMCTFGSEGGGRFLALLASGEIYRFAEKEYKLIYIPTSPVPMSGGLIFAPADSVQKIDMSVDDLMKIYFSLGVLTPQVVPEEYKVAAAG